MSEQQDEQGSKEKKPRLNLTTSQVAASALAACCASIAASYLGVAGTVIGAAVGSVIATIGTAIWSHVFRTGGDRIKQTLSVNGEGRFADAPTELITSTPAHWQPEPEQSAAPPPTPRFLKYRKPIGIAAAILAVFSVSIVVGAVVGAPVRNAGAATTPSTTTTTTVTKTQQGRQGDSSSASTDSSSPDASATSSATPSDSATSSSSASSTASSGTSSSPSPAATATQNQPQATSTDSPNS